MSAARKVTPFEAEMLRLRDLHRAVRAELRLAQPRTYRCPYCGARTDQPAACRAHSDLPALELEDAGS